MSDPTIIYPLALMTGSGLLWGFTVFYNWRLFRAFCKRYPGIAASEIPYAFDSWIRHPEKALFFFRRRAAEVLNGDPVLWPMRQRFVVLAVLSVILPPLAFLPGFLFAIFQVAHK